MAPMFRELRPTGMPLLLPASMTFPPCFFTCIVRKDLRLQNLEYYTLPPLQKSTVNFSKKTGDLVLPEAAFVLSDRIQRNQRGIKVSVPIISAASASALSPSSQKTISGYLRE